MFSLLMKRGWGVYPPPMAKATPAKGLESPRDFYS